VALKTFLVLYAILKVPLAHLIRKVHEGGVLSSYSPLLFFLARGRIAAFSFSFLYFLLLWA
jgi:hypothetical protein